MTGNAWDRRNNICRIVAFRCAKAAFFRGAKGDTCFHAAPCSPAPALRTSVAAAGLVLLLAGAAAAAQRFTITPQERWSGVLAGTQLKLGYTIDAPPGFQGRLSWSLSVDERTVARGETALEGRADRQHRAAIEAKVPEVKEGVVIEARLSVALHDAGRGAALARHQRRLRIFSPQPLAGRSGWLKQLNVTLFDPQGDTAAVLRRAGVPFEQFHNPAALGELTRGVLVIGEGTSFVEHRGLPETMMRLAAGGVPVICLAPAAGTLPMPGAEAADLPKPRRVVLRRQDVIAALDKRLDAEAWPPDGRTATSTVSIVAEGQQVVGRVAKDESGWPWIEVRYPRPRGTLLICGFGMIGRWDAGPAPRYLLARMLEFVTGRQPSPSNHVEPKRRNEP